MLKKSILLNLLVGLFFLSTGLLVLPLFNSAKASSYFLTCSNSICSYTDSSGTPSYLGDSSVTPPILSSLTPSCLDGKPVVTMNWQNSPTSGVGWHHFDRFELVNDGGLTITVASPGDGTGKPPGTIISINGSVQIESGYAGSAPVPDTTALDSHLIPYPSYVPLKPKTRYIYSMRAQMGFEDPPIGLQSPPSNALLITTPDCPQAFNQNLPSASCIGTTSQITLSWQPSVAATGYTVYYMEPGDNPAIDPPKGSWNLRKTDTSFVVPNNLVAGNYYGFIIRAFNGSYTTFSDNGTWSEVIYGWTQKPDCDPPGPFNFTQKPTPSCPGVSNSVIDLGWSSSSKAAGYIVYPQSNIRGWYYNPGGLAPTVVDESGGSLRHQIPPPIPSNEGWEYTILAFNSHGFTQSDNNSSSFYVYTTNGVGYWAPVYNCENPVVDLKLDSFDLIKTINSGSSIQITYSANNAYLLTSSANPVVTPLTPPWTNLYPLNKAVSDPWSTVGSKTVTLYNDGTYPYSTYQFTLSGTNPKLSGSPTDSKSVTVKVLPERAPFLQTTQGDVHSNQNISVPN